MEGRVVRKEDWRQCCCPSKLIIPLSKHTKHSLDWAMMIILEINFVSTFLRHQYREKYLLRNYDCQVVYIFIFFHYLYLILTLATSLLPANLNTLVHTGGRMGVSAVTI